MDDIDQTINHEFKLHIFSRRWNREVVCTITRARYGWFVRTEEGEKGCDTTCSPHLDKLLRRAGIQYPDGLGEWFSWLWTQAKEKGLSHEAVQQGFDDIGKWISNTDQNALVTGFWEGVA